MSTPGWRAFLEGREYKQPRWLVVGQTPEGVANELEAYRYLEQLDAAYLARMRAIQHEVADRHTYATIIGTTGWTPWLDTVRGLYAKPDRETVTIRGNWDVRFQPVSRCVRDCRP